MEPRTQIRHYLEDSGQLRALAALLSVQEHHYPINVELSETQNRFKNFGETLRACSEKRTMIPWHFSPQPAY